MKLHPRYDGEPILIIDGVADPSAALLRQRRRLLTRLAALSPEQWAAPSRCDEWTVQGVVTHLIQTDQFWAISISAGLRGEPTRFLGAFDPVASPAQNVRDNAALTPEDVLARCTAAVEGLASVVGSVKPDQWTTIVAEAPPGHLSLSATALHALWDGWIHERDIAIPLGLSPVEDTEEMELILRYAAGLGPSFHASAGGDNAGVLAVEATDPTVSLLVHAGGSVRVTDGNDPAAPRLTGTTAELIEGLSFRAPLTHDLSDADQWWLHGLAAVFDQV